MADQAEHSFLAAQKAAVQDPGADVGVIEGRADTPDSDDYDPSATLPQDFSVPTDSAQEVPASAHPIPALPEDASAPHALLSPSQNNPLSTPPAQTVSSKTQFPTSQDSAQNQPRLKGGFVIDDEDEEAGEDELKDGDVYGSADGVDAPDPGPVAGLQNSLDSTDSPQVSIPGRISASEKANNVSNRAHGIISSTTPVQNGDAFPRDSTATPAQSLPNIPVKVAQTPSTAGTPVLAVPKTRLAHDVVGILEDRIKDDPRGDMDAWLSLLGELRSRNKKDEVRRVYSIFFKQFPLAVRSSLCGPAGYMLTERT